MAAALGASGAGQRLNSRDFFLSFSRIFYVGCLRVVSRRVYEARVYCGEYFSESLQRHVLECVETLPQVLSIRIDSRNVTRRSFVEY